MRLAGPVDNGLSDKDLEAYFRRVGYSGAALPSLDTLRRLQACHATAIAFENLDPLMRKPVSLSLPALVDKLVRQGRGGYCFEQNALLAAALRALGFSVSGLAALVQWKRSDYGPRIHMVLRIDLPEGPHVADVGFGGLTLTAPLRVEPHVEQPTTLEPFRLMPQDGEHQVQVRLHGEWTPVYRLTLQPVTTDDYEVYNWFTSTHPEVVFTNRLMAARPGEDVRYALLDDQLSVHRLDGPTERRTLTSADELASVLHGTFGLRLPAACEDVLQRVIERSVASARR